MKKPGSSQLGPQRIEGTSVFTRLILGAIGGIAGFLLILLSFLVFGAFTKNLFKDDIVFNGVTNFAILVSLFLSATIMNLLATYLSTLSNQSKYQKIVEGLMQVLTINVVLFIFTIGSFFLAQKSFPDLGMIYGIAVFHLVFSALASVLVFEITATRWSYPLITVYDALLGIFIATVFLLVLYKAVNQDGVSFLLGVPIVTWSILGFVGGLTEYLYYQAYRRMGIDFLQSKQVSEEVTIDDSFEELDDDEPL
jgi:hypothetical protein